MMLWKRSSPSLVETMPRQIDGVLYLSHIVDAKFPVFSIIFLVVVNFMAHLHDT